MNILLDIYLEKNLGDDLFLESILTRYPEHHFYIFSQLDYVVFENKYANLHIVKLNKYVNYLQAKLNKKNAFKQKFIQKNKIEALVCVGGSIFIEFEGWEKLYSERLSLWQYMKERQKKVFIIGSNFGPYTSDTFLNQYDQAFDFVDDVCFRDTYSYDLFKHRTNVRQEADVIMSYPIDAYDSMEDENSIGISVINLSNRKKLAPYQDEYINKTVRMVNDFTLKGKTVHLLSFCEREGDEEIIELILNQITERKEQIEKLYYKGNIEEFLKRFATIKQIITCRFHSIILSVLFDKEFYSLIYSDKSSNFITDYQLNTHMKPIEEVNSLTPQLLMESFSKAGDKSALVVSGEKQYLGLDSFLLGQ